jgi:TAG lipase / steryl ester hydrolase / phospholipase A2 / LPA acyltransferase
VQATTYEDWRTNADELDTLEGNNGWKHDRNSQEYNADLIEARLNQLDDARISCDVARMMFLIRTSLTRSLGGMGDIRLYQHAHIGTKDLIERYIESTCETITKLLALCDGPTAGEYDSRRVLDQILLARQSFGRSALLLSGGGTFGMNHIGVVKALWEARLLPRIISGSSAGSIVCAVLCAKTDAELPVVIQEFCYGELDVFEKDGEEETVMRKAARFLKHGSIFDISHLVRVMRNLLGDLTFQEAYNRTRRILNICVSSASLYELPRLLNYVTAPNVMIWSAV